MPGPLFLVVTLCMCACCPVPGLQWWGLLYLFFKDYTLPTMYT